MNSKKIVDENHKFKIMKKIMIITKKSFMFYMSILAVIGILWSCVEDPVDNPAVPGPTISAIDPNSAWEGDAVTITGTNFFATVTGNNVVSFNGTAAKVTAVTATSITTTVPDGATSGNVIIRVNNQNSDGLAFTIRAPAPTITSLTPGTGYEGTSVTITGTNFSSTPADNTVSFNGTTATVTASSATSLTTTVPDGATSGDVIVTVSGATTETSNGVAFTVLTLPAEATLNILIVDGGDDAEEYRGATDSRPDGYMDRSSSDLELCTQATDNKQMVGLIFRNVLIPAGATITNAYIQFTCDDNDNREGPLPIDIWGIKEANTSAPFLETLFNCTSRPNTTATVNWQAPVWLIKNERGPLEATPDLKEIVQEIIDLSGWIPGNNVGFKFANEETAKIHREAEAFDEGNGGQAGLIVTYTTN